MLAATDKIDLIVECPNGTWRLLVVVEEGEWATTRRRWLMQEKLNTCASFALDGEMHRRYPDSAGKPVEIIVRTVDPMPADVCALIEQIAKIFAGEGLTVTVMPLPPEEPPAAAA